MPANPALPRPTLRIGGITPLTTIDFPGRLAAVLYCQGCPWRCSYCHNPNCSTPPRPPRWTGRRCWPSAQAPGLLDGVVFSGETRTLQAGLPQALEGAPMGFATALHTGGMYPERLTAVLPCSTGWGSTSKAEHRYADITGAPGSGARRLNR